VVDRLNQKQDKLGLKLTHLQMQTRTLSHRTDAEETGILRKLRKVYHGTFMMSGGFNGEIGMNAIVEGDANLIAYGRLFISNLDLLHRFKLGAPWNQYDVATFYTHDHVLGSTNYPFLDEDSQL